VNGSSTVVDVRGVEPKHRLDLILDAWEALDPGAEMDLWVDHDPRCMYYTLRALHGEEALTFAYVADGPEDWHVRVGKSSREGRPALPRQAEPGN
jgi:uncharacterized protein (DUF2249 family)